MNQDQQFLPLNSTYMPSFGKAKKEDNMDLLQQLLLEDNKNDQSQLLPVQSKISKKDQFRFGSHPAINLNPSENKSLFKDSSSTSFKPRHQSPKKIRQEQIVSRIGRTLKQRTQKNDSSIKVIEDQTPSIFPGSSRLRPPLSKRQDKQKIQNKSIHNNQSSAYNQPVFGIQRRSSRNSVIDSGNSSGIEKPRERSRERQNTMSTFVIGNKYQQKKQLPLFLKDQNVNNKQGFQSPPKLQNWNLKKQIDNANIQLTFQQTMKNQQLKNHTFNTTDTPKTTLPNVNFQAQLQQQKKHYQSLIQIQKKSQQSLLQQMNKIIKEDRQRAKEEIEREKNRGEQKVNWMQERLKSEYESRIQIMKGKIQQDKNQRQGFLREMQHLKNLIKNIPKTQNQHTQPTNNQTKIIYLEKALTQKNNQHDKLIKARQETLAIKEHDFQLRMIDQKKKLEMEKNKFASQIAIQEIRIKGLRQEVDRKARQVEMYKQVLQTKSKELGSVNKMVYQEYINRIKLLQGERLKRSQFDTAILHQIKQPKINQSNNKQRFYQPIMIHEAKDQYLKKLEIDPYDQWQQRGRDKVKMESSEYKKKNKKSPILIQENIKKNNWINDPPVKQFQYIQPKITLRNFMKDHPNFHYD